LVRTNESIQKIIQRIATQSLSTDPTKINNGSCLSQHLSFTNFVWYELDGIDGGNWQPPLFWRAVKLYGTKALIRYMTGK
jgi:hypothetical protein